LAFTGMTEWMMGKSSSYKSVIGSIAEASTSMDDLK
jgi:hypothetical protein